MEKVFIHESKYSAKVVEVKHIDEFKDEFKGMKLNGDVCAVYYHHGQIVCEDIWQEIHKNILIS